MGVAFQNHHDVNKKFPLATWTNASPNGTNGVSQTFTPNLYNTIPGSQYGTSTTNPQAGYSWLVRLLPFMEQTVAYNSLSIVSNKFAYPAFLLNGGMSVSGVQVGCRYAAGGNPTWWRHFATIDLEDVRCPSFSGEKGSDYPGYQMYDWNYSGGYSPKPSGSQFAPRALGGDDHQLQGDVRYALCLHDQPGRLY